MDCVVDYDIKKVNNDVIPEKKIHEDLRFSSGVSENISTDFLRY